MDMIKHISKKEGVSGLYKGFTLALGTNIGTMISFGVIFQALFKSNIVL